MALNIKNVDRGMNLILLRDTKTGLNDKQTLLIPLLCSCPTVALFLNTKHNTITPYASHQKFNEF